MKKLQQYEDEARESVLLYMVAVMTNIIINNYDKIKFIDMRGKLGNTLTLCGDYLYDWAKLYQSLLGYDEILQGKFVTESYKKEFVSFFEKYFIELFSEGELQWVKIITRSLFFTLIPLHNNKMCYEYYRLV